MAKRKNDQTLPMMALGAKGVISVASNVVPAGIAKLCRTCLDNDFAAAAEIHRKYALLFRVLFIEVNPIPVKAALQMMGLDRGAYRLPLCPPEEAHLRQIEECLRGLSLIA